MSIVLVFAISSSRVWAQQQIRNGKIAVTSAKVRLKYKKYDEALEILEEGRRVDPGHAELYPLLGSLYVRKAASMANDSTILNSVSEDSTFVKSAMEEDVFKDFMLSFNSERKSMMAYLVYSEYKKAKESFDKAVSLDGKLEKKVKEERLEEWSKLVNRGVKSMKAEEYDEAILSLTNATIIYPEGVEAYINLGASYSNSGLHRMSIKPFRKALEMAPEDIDLKLAMARVYDNLGKPDSAKVFYKQCLTIQPDNLSVKEGLATCYLREGSLDSAGALYNELLSGEEVNPDIAFNAGLVEFQRENWAGAAKDFKITVDNYPEDIEARENLSIALMQLEKYEEVIPHLEKIVELDDSNREAWGSLIVAYAQVGMNEKASKANEKYRELGGE